MLSERRRSGSGVIKPGNAGRQVVNVFNTVPGTRTIPSTCFSTALAIGAICFSPFAHAQQADLSEKLKDLNVRVQTEHYVLAGTINDARLDLYGQALEYIYREYTVGFSKLIEQSDGKKKTDGSKKKKSRHSRRNRKSRDEPSQHGATQSADEQSRSIGQDDEQRRFRVIVFAQRREYEEFGAAFFRGQHKYTCGMFVPAHDLLLVLDRGNFDDTYEVLFHEAFHQFMRRYIKNPPVWLNEGLATHYGYARPTPTGLTFRQPPTIYWKLTRKLISKHQTLPLWQVVSASPAEFYDQTPVHVRRFENITRGSLYYAHAYTLVHLLLSDEGGRQRLRDYIRDLAQTKGKSSAEITREYFGSEVCDYLTPHWIDYVNSRPEYR